MTDIWLMSGPQLATLWLTGVATGTVATLVSTYFFRRIKL
jgi:hypothetical protein